jgi:energy-coupling factor transporter transmembrane protein EcfT
MWHGNTPYAYRPGNSALHRAPALLKLAGLLAVSVAALFSVYGMVGAAGVVLLACALARVRPWTLLRGSRGLFLMMAFIVAFRAFRFDGLSPAFDLAGLLEGLQFCLGIMVSFCAGSLLFSVTTMSKLREALPRGRLALGITLMLGFLPRFFEIWEDCESAYRARAGKNGLRKIVALIPLVTERMIELAVETALTLEARGLRL